MMATHTGSHSLQLFLLPRAWAMALFAADAVCCAHAQLAPAAHPATHLVSGGGNGSGGSHARENSLRSVQRNSALGSTGAHSALRAVAGPATRLERVQQLKQALRARETANQETVIDLPADVLFDFDKSTLRPDALPVLAQAAELIGAYPQSPVCINGHTDSKGSDRYNQALSLRRAQSVAAQLQHRQGAHHMRVYGFGKSQPVAANTMPDGSDNPQGRQRNRRVEIVIGAVSNRGSLSAAGHSGAKCTLPTQEH